MRKLFSGFIAVVALLPLAGCAPTLAPSPVLISSIRPELPNTKTIELSVSRKEFDQAWGLHELNSKARLIEVFHSGQGSTDGIPEYRVFGVYPKSVYFLLGLRNADVLIGAQGYLIKSSVAFQRYLSVVSREAESQLDIMRDGAPLVLKFRFVD